MMEEHCWNYVFFFQAEDGIRDLTVTGVQTCALPISIGGLPPTGEDGRDRRAWFAWVAAALLAISTASLAVVYVRQAPDKPRAVRLSEIGRASCRERV